MTTRKKDIPIPTAGESSHRLSCVARLPRLQVNATGNYSMQKDSLVDPADYVFNFQKRVQALANEDLFLSARETYKPERPLVDLHPLFSARPQFISERKRAKTTINMPNIYGSGHKQSYINIPMFHSAPTETTDDRMRRAYCRRLEKIYSGRTQTPLTVVTIGTGPFERGVGRAMPEEYRGINCSVFRQMPKHRTLHKELINYKRPTEALLQGRKLQKTPSNKSASLHSNQRHSGKHVMLLHDSA